jgi:hypothetical protein
MPRIGIPLLIRLAADTSYKRMSGQSIAGKHHSGKRESYSVMPAFSARISLVLIEIMYS